MALELVGWTLIDVPVNYNLEAKLAPGALIAAKHVAVFGPTPHVQAHLPRHDRRDIAVRNENGPGVLERFWSYKGLGSSLFALTRTTSGKLKSAGIPLAGNGMRFL